MPELDDEQVQLWRRLTELADTIATAQAEERHVKELLRKFPAGTYTRDGEPVLRLATSQKFDAQAAFQALPPEVAAQCVTTTPDAKAVRAQFSDAAASAYMAEGTARVTLL